MASRALRALRRPLYSLIPRTLATPPSSPLSSLLSNSIKNSDVFGANNSGKENLHLLKVVSARSITSNSGLSSCLPLLYVGLGFRVFVEQLFTELARGAGIALTTQIS